MCEEPMFLLILSLCAKHFVVFNTSELVSHEPMVTTTSEKTVHNVNMAIRNANIIQYSYQSCSSNQGNVKYAFSQKWIRKIACAQKPFQVF